MDPHPHSSGGHLPKVPVGCYFAIAERLDNRRGHPGFPGIPRGKPDPEIVNINLTLKICFLLI